MLDKTVTDRLRGLGGDALVRRMVRLFLVTSEEARLRIDAALANNHAHVAQAAAHHLFASAAQLRLGGIAELAERVENAARSGEIESAQSLAAELKGSLADAGVELRQFLAELPGAASVVVVDDSEDVRVLLHLILESQFDVTEYETGTTALAGIRRMPPDLIIIDVSLPDMSGVDLLRAIRADDALFNVPAVALTALAEPEHTSFVETGFDLYIRKPVVDSEEFLRALDRVMKNRQRVNR